MALVTYLPRLDLPAPPESAPAYYVGPEGLRGLGSIYLHTPADVWFRGGRQIDAASVPHGSALKKLGAVE